MSSISKKSSKVPIIGNITGRFNMDNMKDKLKYIGLCLLPTFGRLLLTCLIAAIVAIIGILVYNSPPSMYSSFGLVIDWSYDPRQLLPVDANFTYNILLDPHCHTTYSDGSLTPEQNIQWHIANGYNSMVVTDHNTMDGAFVAQKIAREKYNDSIKVLIGMEWSNCRCHMNFIGLQTPIKPISNPTNEEIQDAIKQGHDQGAIVIYNHRPWSYWAGVDQPSPQMFADWGVDYFDVANTYYFDMQTFLWARSKGYAVCTANDFHSSTEATGWTLLNKPNAGYDPSAPINATYFTEQDLFDLFKAKQTSLLFQVTGSGYDVGATLEANPKYNFASPWIKVGDFFHSFYSLQRGIASFVDGGSCGNQTVTIFYSQIKSTVLWFLFLFFGCEILRALIIFLYKFIQYKRSLKSQNTKYVKTWENEFGVVDTPLLNTEL